MSKRLNVYKDQKPIYDIVMEPSFEKLTEEVNKFHLSERKICIVTDTNVAPLYLEEVKERLSKCCFSYFYIENRQTHQGSAACFGIINGCSGWTCPLLS